MRDLLAGVGCIGLFGGDTTPRQRGARNAHDTQQPPQYGELNHAPPANRNSFFRKKEARKHTRLRLRYKPPNAANHPPAHPRLIRATLERVGCIGLFGRVATLRRRAARDTPDTQAATRRGDLITPRSIHATVFFREGTGHIT